MSEKPHDSVLGSLPHSRPHRRSQKRPARPQAQQRPQPAGDDLDREEAAAPGTRARAAAPGTKAKATAPGTKAKATATRAAPRAAPPAATATDVLGIAVKAALELTEIGLTAGTRALRHAVSRLPRP